MKQFAQITQKNAPVHMGMQFCVQDAEHRADTYAVVCAVPRAAVLAETYADARAVIYADVMQKGVQFCVQIPFAEIIAPMQKTVQFFVQKTQTTMKVRIVFQNHLYSSDILQYQNGKL